VANFIYRRQLTIEWAFCDPAGIVFNSRFFELFDGSTWALFEAALGVPKHQLSAAFDILGIPLVDARAQFMAPVKFGDRVEMQAHVSEFRRSSFDVAHRILIGGELATEGRETRVWAGWDERDPARMRARPVPDEVRAKFQIGDG
jgi:4-hydroxybenzoyl-CoA thioesterase